MQIYTLKQFNKIKEMKRTLFTLFALFLVIQFQSLNIKAQDKKLTIEDAVIGLYTQLRTEYLQQLQWRGNTDYYTYVVDSKLTQGSPTSSKTKSILSLDELNKVLKKNNIKEIEKHFPVFDWLTNNSIQFEHVNHLLVYNIESKKIELNIKYDEKAENLDFCIKKNLIAYTLNNNLFIIAQSGEVSQITSDDAQGIVNGQSVHRREFGITKGTFWSPEGNYLAFYRKDETMVTDYPLVDISKRIAELENIKYPMAGMKSHQVTLGIYNLTNKKTLFIEPQTFGPEQYLTNISWSPGEKHIYIAELNREQNYMKLNQYDVTTGKFIKTLFEEKHEKYVEPEHPMKFFTTRKNEFLWLSERDGYEHIYHYNTDGKLLKQLTKGEWVVTDILGFDSGEDHLYFISTAESPVERRAYKVNINSGKISRLSKAQGTHSAKLSANGKYLLDIYSSVNTPGVFYIISSEGKIIKNLLTAENPLKDYKLGEMALFTIKAADEKTDLYCRLLKPVDFDPTKKYPVIIYVYGGPHAQLVSNSWLGGARLWDYYMAQKGYVIFTIDNRGSANRGFEFENIIHRQIGYIEMQDQKKGIEYLRALTYVDTSRIGVFGWSYGGFMTISLMLHQPETFKVGVAGGPVTDWKYYEVMYGERYMDTPDENPEGYKNASLLNNVKNLKGKLLVIHGGIDNTVVWQNSLSFVRKCIEQDVMLDYFVYPCNEHNVRGTDRIHLMKKVTQYFEDYLKL